MEHNKKICVEEGGLLTLLHCMDTAVLLFDPNGECILVNGGARDLLGLYKRSCIGNHFESLCEIQYKKNIMDWSKLKKLVDSKASVCMKNVYLRTHKTKFLAQIALTEVEYEKKRVVLFVVSHLFEDMIDQAKSNFMSIITHQIRTPLSSMRWNLEMLLDKTFGEFNSEQKAVIDEIYWANSRLLDYLGELLQVSEIETHGVKVQKEKTDLAKLIKEIVDDLIPLARARNVDVDINAPKKKVPKLMLDPIKTRIILHNILDNSLKYNVPGGKVSVNYSIKKDILKVSIVDTGLGIPKKSQDKIFNKFFRAKNAAKKVSEGTGVGLYICYSLIHALKGTIHFVSNEGKGTTFYFTLPLNE